MSNVCAAIGRGQMTVLQDRINQRRLNFELYEKHLGGISGITFLKEPLGYYSNRWLSTILVDPLHTNGISREDIRLALEKENIESRPLWKPMHMQPIFEQYPYYGTNVSENLFDQGLCLPSGSNLTTSDHQLVVKNILAVFGK
jgi:dTDP-4-amino-4,6-dideoxygalactose transaminase